MTHTNPPRPTSSPPRPTNRDDLTHSTSSRRPYPERDEVELSRQGRPPANSSTPRPGDDLRDDVAKSEPKPLITPRTLPFWQDLRDLLNDGQWHHRADIYALGHKHTLADRTIANLLPRASARRWISRSRGQVRIRDHRLLDNALGVHIIQTVLDEHPKDGA